jgi:hypothetical protein
MKDSRRFTMAEIRKMPFEQQVVLLQWGVRSGLFRSIYNHTTGILDYTGHFLNKDCLKPYFEYFILKLDFTTDLESDLKADHQFILETVRIGLEAVFYDEIFNKHMNAFEKESLIMKGEAAEVRAGELSEIIGRLKIDTRNFKQERSIKKRLMPYYNAAIRENKKLSFIDYLIMLASFQEAVLLDLLDRYSILFDSLRIGATFKPFVKPLNNIPELSLKQQALYLHYSEIHITSKNAGIYLPKGLSSTQKLLQDFNSYSSSRARTEACETERSFKSRMKDFEVVIDVLKGEAKERAEREFSEFLQKNNNWL